MATAVHPITKQIYATGTFKASDGTLFLAGLLLIEGRILIQHVSPAGNTFPALKSGNGTTLRCGGTTMVRYYKPQGIWYYN